MPPALQLPPPATSAPTIVPVVDGHTEPCAVAVAWFVGAARSCGTIWKLPVSPAMSFFVTPPRVTRIVAPAYGCVPAASL